MKNVVENEEMIVEEIVDEKAYQQIKKEMCKTSDYFTIEEWHKLCNC